VAMIRSLQRERILFRPFWDLLLELLLELESSG